MTEDKPKFVNSYFIKGCTYLILAELLKKLIFDLDANEMLIWQLENDRYDDEEIADPDERLAAAKIEEKHLVAYIAYVEQHLFNKYGLLTRTMLRHSETRARYFTKREKIIGEKQFDNLSSSFMDPEIKHPVFFEMLQESKVRTITVETFHYRFQITARFHKIHCFDGDSYISLCGTAHIEHYFLGLEVPEDHENNCKICKLILNLRRKVGYNGFARKTIL